MPAPEQEGGGAAQQQHDDRRAPKERVAGRKGRPEQNELAIAIDHIGDHLVVGVAGDETVADQDAQIARQLGVGIIDRLVLTDHAAQAGRDIACAVLKRRIVEDLVGIDGMGRRRAQGRDQRERCNKTPHSAGSALAAANAS